ncbi:MAG: bifunctional DNA-formamidopyrimidine glycosylase/DNA-(apurinic or apyrimidinic site) lyase [Acidimicrobiales bacterium]
METIRRDLERVVVGRRIGQVTVTGARSVRRHGTAAAAGTAATAGGCGSDGDQAGLPAGLRGRLVVAVGRRGKYLLARLDDRAVLVVHLGMSGQLAWSTGPVDPLPKHTHVTIAFEPEGELRFVDPRTFGEIFLTATGDPEGQVPELAHLGSDPVADTMSWTDFAARLHARRTRLKALLMDQRFLAGIGNIYSDEILFGAGLRFDRVPGTLTSQDVRRLYRSMRETLSEAIRLRGSSLADQQYRDLFGQIGGYQAEHQVYARQGQPCRRCRASIIRVRSGGRSSYYCPGCQV